MPQPLSRVAKNANIIVNNVGDYPLRRHPELALLAMQAIVSWTQVEAFMQSLFVFLMGGDKDKATIIYLALDGQNAKERAVEAVAKKVLSAENLVLMNALLKKMKTYHKARNKLVHWMWGDSPNLVDALLLVNPKDWTDKLDYSCVYVYHENDFKNIISNNEDLCRHSLEYEWVIKNHPANRNGKLYTKLCRELGIH